MGGPKDKTTAPGNNFFEDDDFFEDENTGEVEPAAPADDPPAPAPTEPDPLAVVAGGSSAPVSEADQADQAEGGFGARPLEVLKVPDAGYARPAFPTLIDPGELEDDATTADTASAQPPLVDEAPAAPPEEPAPAPASLADLGPPTEVASAAPPAAPSSVGVSAVPLVAFSVDASGGAAWEAAIGALEAEAAAVDPASADALRRDAARVALFLAGDPGRALSLLAETSDGGPGGLGATPDAVRLRAEALWARAVGGSDASAREVGSRAWAAVAGSLQPEHATAAADAWRRAATLADEPQLAAACLGQALEADPSDVMAAWQLTELAARIGRDDLRLRALELLDAAVRRDGAGSPELADVARAHADALTRAGRSDEAGAVLTSAHALARGGEDDGTLWLALRAHLGASGDDAGLAALAAAEAAGRSDADVAAFSLASARASRRAGDAPAAIAAYALAATAGGQVARAEQIAWLAAGWAQGTIPGAAAALADAAAGWAEVGEPDAVAFLALVHEVATGDAEAALAAWSRRDDAEGRAGVERLTRRLGRAGDADALATAEAAERAGGDLTAIDLAAVRGGAYGRRGAEAAVRLARRRGEPATLAGELEALAERVGPGTYADQLRAERALVLLYGLGDATAALPRFGDQPGALDAGALQVATLTAAGRHLDAAAALEGAAHYAYDASSAADLLLRAALLRRAGGDAWTAVEALLEGALARVPGLPDALAVQAEGGGGAVRPEALIVGLRGSDCPASAGLLGALAGLDAPEAGDLTGVAAAIAAARAGDSAGWTSWLATQDEASAWVDRIAGGARPDVAPASVAVARALEAVGEAGRASDVALAAGERALALRLATQAGPDADRVAAALGESPSVALQARARPSEAHALLAQGTAGSLRAAHLVLSGGGAPALADALEARPESFELAQSALVAAVQAGDADAAERVLVTAKGVWPDVALQRAITSSNLALDGAAEAWAAAGEALIARLGLEVALAAASRWSDVLVALSGRIGVTTSASERERAEGVRRWILAEKLGDSDEALACYEELHAGAPEDREVLENLARIYGRRGDHERAVASLERLAESASSPAEAARYQRRIAEVWLGVGDDAYAQTAFYAALDHQSDDRLALSGLRDIATRGADWLSLSTLLKREAALVSGEARVALLHELATLTDERLDNPAMAAEAWRAVVEANPRDGAALRRLIALTADRGEHAAFLEVGASIEPLLDGEDRTLVLRRMAESSEAMGRREDAISQYEQAVASEDPDRVAAARLEVIYRDNQDYPAVIRMLLVRARAPGDAAERVSALLEAARIEREIRHDRDAAARLYDEVLAIDPHDRVAVRYLAGWTYDNGRLAEALPLYERMASFVEEGEDLTDFDTSMEVASFWFRLAEMLRGERRDDDAKSRYMRALELNPTHLPSLEAVGPLLAAAEDWDKVGDVYQRILQLTGGQGEPARVAQLYTMLGHVDRQKGNAERAYKRYQKALEVQANHVAALKGVAAILEEREDWSNLLNVYNNVIYHATLPRDVTDAYLTKGRILDEKLERPDKAVPHYERSLEFEHRQPGVWLRLAEIGVRRAQWDQAVRYATQGLEVAGDEAAVAADLHLVAAVAHAVQGDTSSAESCWAAAQAASPAVAEAAISAAGGHAPLEDIPATIAALRLRLPR